MLVKASPVLSAPGSGMVGVNRRVSCFSFFIEETTLVGIYKFNQMPDIYTIIGLLLIISGVLIVNLLGKTN